MSYSSGRVRSCWNMLSAMTSLMRIRSAGALPSYLRTASSQEIVWSPNSSAATSYPQARKAPSVNFMMFPLCTRVTDFRPFWIAYRMALRTRRLEPVSLIGFIPIPLSGRRWVLNSFSRISIIRRASGDPSSHSIPAYTSSVPSRKMTMSSRSGWVTGLGMPGIQEIGRMFAYRSSVLRIVTFRDRKPPPTGVVIGPLSATTYSRIAARVASGSISPYRNIAFSPAGTGYQAIFRRPPAASSTAASTARTATRTTSGPIPSPSISGMIGSSGTRRPASVMRILWPRSGSCRTRRSEGISPTSFPLVEGDVLEVLRADVPVERSEETIVLPILDDMGGPAGDPREREDRREEVRRDAHAVEHLAGVEVHVREDLFRGEFPDNRLFDRRPDPEVRVVPLEICEFARVLFEDQGPRIVRLVDAVAKPGDFLLVPQHAPGEFLRPVRRPDRLHHVEGALDRAAVHRTFQRRNRRDDRAMEVRQGGGGDGRPECGGVHPVVRVEDQGRVHDPGVPGLGSLARDEPEEILGVAQPRVGSEGPLAFPDPIVRGHDRGELGRKPQRLSRVRGLRVVVPLWIEVAHVGDGRPQDVHRRRVIGHRPEELQDRRGKGPGRGEVRPPLLEFRVIGEMPLEQEKGRLLERGVLREVPDVVPAVQEAPALTVDETDRRLLHVHVLETAVDLRGVGIRLHGDPPVRYDRFKSSHPQ